ncbi:uncharacterized protein A4U43_C08F17080 [Asparagus officinalis]|nr:uncharacterized protein A4U43_C08F17080 [Asparagus officinalis]
MTGPHRERDRFEEFVFMPSYRLDSRGSVLESQVNQAYVMEQIYLPIDQALCVRYPIMVIDGLSRIVSFDLLMARAL